MDINTLESKRVFYWFERINAIPRGSGNEKAVSDMLRAFAEERGLYVRQDEANNIIIKKPAAAGMENRAPILIQGHMDMVCEKLPNSKHDFLSDPIKIIYDGDFIRAEDTTLGADDGIAVAYALALLDADDVVHPELQVLITTDEEVGMGGAAFVDVSDITAKYVLNIDSEDEGIFTVGCAGGMKTTSVLSVDYENADNMDFFRLDIGNLTGGHSGVEIDKERANANKLMARLLSELSQNMDIRAAEINGGAKDNAIPRTADCVLACNGVDTPKLFDEVKRFNDSINHEFEPQGEDIKISLAKTEKTAVFTADSLKKVLTVMLLMPNGVLAVDTRLNMPQTSNNLGVVKTENGKLYLTCAVRSSVISRKYAVYNKIRLLTELAGGSCTYKGDYPAWEFKNNGSLVKQVSAIFEAQYGHKPKIETIHAGLECGLLSEKLPNAEFISFGPDIYDIHTTSERAVISSVENTYKLIKAFLAQIV